MVPAAVSAEHGRQGLRVPTRGETRPWARRRPHRTRRSAPTPQFVATPTAAPGPERARLERGPHRRRLLTAALDRACPAGHRRRRPGPGQPCAQRPVSIRLPVRRKRTKVCLSCGLQGKISTMRFHLGFRPTAQPVSPIASCDASHAKRASRSGSDRTPCGMRSLPRPSTPESRSAMLPGRNPARPRSGGRNNHKLR